MREIKFRAWNTTTRGYLYTGDWKGKFKLSNLFTYTEDTPDVYEVEQFTGLHDKNGKEVYEGDIVKSIDSDFNRVIKWSDITPSFTMQRDDFKECVWYNEKYCEVIGNIHENPELISEQQYEK